MPLVYDPTVDYMKSEVWGASNTGKTIFLFSIVKLPPPKWAPNKKKIILFTNEAHFAKTVRLLDPEDQKRFEVYQHRTLEEFDKDMADMLFEYGVYANDRETLTNDYSKIEKDVLAILVDEIHVIYWWLCMRRTAELKIDALRPAQYGVPRKWLIDRMKLLYSMPCHVLMACKVKPEYEPYRETKADGTEGALQFRKTGFDEYPLFDDFEYLTDTRMYLFRVAEMQEIDDPLHPDTKIPVVNMLGKEMFVYPQYGEVVKNKAKGDERFTLEAPTVRKLALKLRALARLQKVDW